MPASLLLGPVTVDLTLRLIHHPEGTRRLSEAEARILAYLAERSPEVVSRESLRRDVLGYAEGVRSRAEHHAITRLRRKLELDPRQPRWLQSVYGEGYRLILPAPADPDFVGRRQELSAVAEALSPGILTLTGPPGVGKSALARQLTVHAGFPEHLTCDLRGVSGEEALCAALAEILQIPLGTAPITSLGHALAGRGRLLLILDSAEGLDEGAAEILQRLCAAARQLCVVVTSRRALLDTERQLAIRPMSTEDATALFLRRAGRPISRVEAVGALVRALDCLPLAIELAAVRVRQLSPEQILSLLGERFALLRTERVSLQDTLKWSWDLLSPTAVEALGCLSLFSGRFDLDAAAAVLPEGSWAPDMLAELDAHSLLEVSTTADGPLYHLLDSIRDFALSRSGHPAARVRLREWLVQTAPQATGRHYGPESLAALRWIRRHRLDLLSALRAAEQPSDRVALGVCLDVVLSIQGDARGQLRMWQDITAAAELSPLLRAAALRRRGEAARLCRRQEQGEADVRAALQLAESAGHVGLTGLAHGTLGALLLAGARFAEAESHLSAALACYQRQPDPWGRFMALMNRGSCAWALGQLDTAETWYLRALSESQDARDRRGQGLAQSCLGAVHLQAGRLSQASDAFAQALQDHGAVGDQHATAVAEGNLGGIALERGELADAEPQLQAAIQRSRRIGARRLEGLFTTNLALCRIFAGEPSADRLLSEAIYAFEVGGNDPRLRAYATAYRGVLLARAGRLERAAAALDEADEALAGVQDKVGRVVVALCRAHLEPETAAAAIEEARSGKPSPAERSMDVRLAIRLLTG